jgi:heme A synthase
MRAIAGFCALLTVLISAGSALIRRWREGLGCDAWTACAGVFQSEEGGVPAAIEFVRLGHRISASTVGLLVALLLLYGWQRFDAARRAVALLAVGTTLLLAWLGQYSSVASPQVTLGNVVGGMVLIAALGWLAAPGPGRLLAGDDAAPRASAMTPGEGIWNGPGGGLAHWVALALLVLAVATGTQADGIDDAGLPGIGDAHALFAGGFVLLAAWLGLAQWRRGAGRSRRPAALMMALVMALIGVQGVTGIAMALKLLPLLAATAHNASSALLAAWLGSRLARDPGFSPRVARAVHRRVRALRER